MAGVPLRRVADFPLHSLQQFNRIGVTNCGDLLRLGRLQVCEIIGVSTSDADALLDLAARKACPEPSSALEMWQIQEEEESRPYAIPTLLRQLDSKLGGIRKGCITEICGPAGVGKSTLSSCVAVQCAVPLRQGGHNAPVIVLDTELKFSAERLAEIALCRFPQYFGDSVAGPDRVREMLGKITVLSVRSARELDITMGRLEDAAARTSAGLVIFDSVAALARDGFGAGSSFARVARLNRHAAQLKRIAESLGLAVLVTNQVSGRAPRNSSGSAASSRAAERPSSTWVLPALGVVWTHAVNVRVVMDVSPVQPLGDWRERGGGPSSGGDRHGEQGGVADPTLASAEALLRRIHVIKSPTAPATVVPFVITEAGVVDPPVELIAALPQGADLGARGGVRRGGTASAAAAAAAGAGATGGSGGSFDAPVGAGGQGGQQAQGGLRSGSLPAVAPSSSSYHYGGQAVSMGASHGGGAMVASADEAAALAAAADYLLAGIGGEDQGVHEAGAGEDAGGAPAVVHGAGVGSGVTTAGATEMDLLAGAMDDLEAEAEAELLMAELETAAGQGVTSAGAAGGSGGLEQGSGVQAMERGHRSGVDANDGASNGPWHGGRTTGSSWGGGAVRVGGSGAQVAMDGSDEVDDLLQLAAELD